MADDLTESGDRTINSSFGPVRMPVRYPSGMGIQAMFWVPRSHAARLLAPLGIDAAPMPLRRALAGVGFFSYPDSDLGPYLETGLSLFGWTAGRRGAVLTLRDQLRPLTRRRSGWAVLDLPVTRERASAVGRECWGLPKFVTGITFELERRRFGGRLDDPDGMPICTLAGSFGAGLTVPSPDTMLFTVHRDGLFRTPWTMDGRSRLVSGRGLTLSIGRSRHAMAEQLRALNLDEARPFAALVTPRLQAAVHEGSAAHQ